MYLRKIKLKDASLMHEWMSDSDITQYMRGNFSESSIEDAKKFIRNIKNIENRIDFAICSNTDEYMGTITLKNINRINNSAELSMVVRKKAMNKGYAWFAISEIIKKAFDRIKLECVYWCVPVENEKAIHFFEKHHFHENLDISREILDRYNDNIFLKWYSVLKGDKFDIPQQVVGCRVVNIKTIPTVEAGQLSFFEVDTDIDFEIKRVYYISKVNEGVRRGFHAHKNLKQLLFCPYGRIQLILENENGREEIELSDPSIGIEITSPTWREMLWLQSNSVLCVVASEKYDPNDYIRDYEEFRDFIK